MKINKSIGTTKYLIMKTTTFILLFILFIKMYVLIFI